jgi:hypothetical protein
MSNVDWYAKKLSGQKPTTTPPVSPPKPVTYVPQVQTPNVQVSYDQKEDQLVTRAMSAKETENCPGCYSGNYFAPMGTQRKRCYDCGYPIVQAGTGVTGTGTGNPATPAKQVGQGGGFRPDVIIDRIG